MPAEINLDHPPPPEQAAAQSLRSRLRHRPGYPNPVLAGLGAGLIAVLLLTLTGAPPPPASARVVFHTSADAFHLDDHHVYTIHSAPDQTARVTAHDLSTGRTAWRSEIPAGTDHHFRSFAGHRLVLTTSFDLGEGTTSALDWQTGELLWTAAGSPAAVGDELVVLEQREDGRPLSTAPVLSAVDPTTGSPRWQLPAALSHVTADIAEGRVYGAHEGELIRFDPATGEPVAATKAAEPPWVISHLQTIDSAVLVQQLDFQERVARLRAFDSQSLTLRWELDTQIGPDDAVFPVRCGELLCLAGDGVLHGVDPATGEKRWTAADPVRYIIWHAPAGEHPFSDHLLVVAGPDPRGPQRLLATDTGQTVATFSDWRLVPGSPGADVEASADAPTLALRAAGDAGPRLGVLRPDRSGIIPLTTAGGEPPDQPGCLVQWPHLVCRSDAPGARASLTVWLVDPKLQLLP
ncbi:PQQ-like beta-propeller repeat protein [Natronosporangium hydrolyticum]|uniref:PQQ-like beta-propeller repeat protein n=1 Tax=Natronosporangium hydrolyticum TaxID=2811111 RepID=A0A895YEC7_9ACTN|nr:PQQ-binding-like beta-propeller repeat protein [Natronosporangium hydrolyticum]QSB14515.1 PQQ-like beta-propeller repeat protein [Natronosporangium hydrolyticum]